MVLTPAALAELPSFAEILEDLPAETYMAYGGRCRRRRFAAFAVSAKTPCRRVSPLAAALNGGTVGAATIPP
ncbi:MAG: hypothetical protein ACRECZ_05435 [Methylocella sp.]